MKILHVPYLCLNLLYFYVTSMLTEMKIDFGTEFSRIRFGFYTFDTILEQVIEFTFMNLMILMTIYAG